MASVPVPNCALAEMRYSLDGQDVENTLWFRFQADIVPSDLEDLGTALLSWWEANLRPLQPTALTLREVYMTDQTTPNGPSFTQLPLGANTGERAEAILPSNVSLAVSFRTNFRGRGFRGRNYVLGLTENMVTANQVAPTVVADYAIAYAQLPTFLEPLSITHVVASRYLGNAPRPVGVSTPVTAYLCVDGTVDSQRRRLPGRGR